MSITLSAPSSGGGQFAWSWSGASPGETLTGKYKTGSTWYTWKTLSGSSDTFNGAVDTTYYFLITGSSSGDSNTVGPRVSATDSATETLSITEKLDQTNVYKQYAIETMAMTEATAITKSVSLTVVDTVTVTDSKAKIGVQSLESDYQWYLGSFDGKVYAERDVYKSDDGTSITCDLITKQTDFADEHIQLLGKSKTLYKIRLFYVDLWENTTVSIHASTDGGTTWETKEASFGNADETVKFKDYYFVKSGHVFQFKVTNDSGDDEFQWIALEAHVSPGGDYFA